MIADIDYGLECPKFGHPAQTSCINISSYILNVSTEKLFFS